jgi:hypothetical protein
MSTKTIQAAADPSLANSLIEQALAEPDETPNEITVQFPSDTLVNLPGGFINSSGEIVRTAEVRELTGRDEEIIARTGNVARALNATLIRGVVKLGNEDSTEVMLDQLLGGDRDELLLGIYKVTFGNPAELNTYCGGCDSDKTVYVDLDKDIARKTLSNPAEDRTFTVKGRNGKSEYEVNLPTGKAQKEMSENIEKTNAELTTILLQNTVTKINGSLVLDKRQILDIGLNDREIIQREIAQKVSGPKFDNIVAPCPECGEEVVVPIDLGRFFRF